MAFQPFALDQYFKEMIDGGISKGKAREQWFDEKSNEATLELAAEAEKIKKKMEGAKGFFGKKFGKWGKALLPLLVNMALPGSGLLLGGIMAGTDAIGRQSEYKKRLEDLKDLTTKKGKYAGTFLQDYFERGMEGIKGQTTKALEGLKQTDLITGLLDVGVSVIPGLSKLGKKDKLINIFGDKTAYAGVGAGETIIDQGGLSSIEALAPAITKSAGKNIFNTKGLKNIFDLATGGVSGAYDIATTPLINANTDTIKGQLISSLSTPSTYSPVIRDEYMKYINQLEEAAVTKAQSPYKRYRV